MESEVFMTRMVILNAVLFLSAMPAFVCGQTGSELQVASPDSAAPAYDIGSIKPNKSGSANSGIDSDLYTFKAVNVSLANLIESVYGIKKDLISGVPKPLDTARFDVSAKLVDPDVKVLKQLTPSQYRAMLQPLLMERFQLKVHMEVKQLPVYDMVVLKGGPKFGPEFKEAPKGFTGSTGTHSNNGELTATAISMVALTDFLFNQVHRTVIDKTGLTGKYDLALKWSPEDSPETAGETFPPIFTALQEQLGLKLKPAKGPVETLVIDHAEIPSPD